MKNFFLLIPARKRKNNPNANMLISIPEPPRNTNEGSEFLDDAIRTEDQPLRYAKYVSKQATLKNHFSHAQYTINP